MESTEAQDLGLLWRYLQAEFLQPLRKRLIDPLCVLLKAEGAYPIVRVPPPGIPGGAAKNI